MGGALLTPAPLDSVLPHKATICSHITQTQHTDLVGALVFGSCKQALPHAMGLQQHTSDIPIPPSAPAKRGLQRGDVPYPHRDEEAISPHLIKG